MSNKFVRAFALLASLSLAACDTAGGTTGDEQNASEGHEPAEAAAAVIEFDAAWNETVVDGELVEGGTAVLDYDDERVAACVATQGGIAQYAVTAHYAIDGGEAQAVVVAGLNATDEPTIELAEAGTLEIWFEATSTYGCHEWDSNLGDNYRFEVGAAE